jgi:hypothetical protein
METKLTHWKKLTNPDYLGSYDFEQGEERIVTIKDVKRMLVNGADGKKEDCTVVYFEENYKPMIMNVTNQKAITKLAETPYIEQWVGKSFKIVVVKIKAFGEFVDALRIKSEKVVKAKPVLELNSTNFINCKKAYQADKTALDKIKAKYQMSETVERMLIAE